MQGGAALLAGVVLSATCLGDEISDSVIVGKAMFRRQWVAAPTRTDAADGLGPLFNARSCAGCHPGGGPASTRVDSDGRTIIAGAVVRVGDAHGAPHPWYGKQLQTQAVPGLLPEAVARSVVDAGDGHAKAEIRLLGEALGPAYRLGVRIAPSLMSRGRIEAVAESAIRERSRSDVQHRLGLSGRARVLGADGQGRIGRFGWKASEPDLASQTAAAFSTDLGLSSPLRPQPYGDCTPLQTACLAMPSGDSRAFDGHEISGAILAMVAGYVASLDGPRGPADAGGVRIFERIGCASCHVPSMAADGGGQVELFSDLLLHDMGAGLDDGVGEPGVRSSEWRTAPLLDVSTRGGRRRYLHDGRAASVAEAIGWHDGEGRSSRLAFDGLGAGERAALISYVEAR